MILADNKNNKFKVSGTSDDLFNELIQIVNFFSEEVIVTDGEKERLINVINIIINEGLNNETKEKINKFNKESILKETKNNLGIRSIE